MLIKVSAGDAGAIRRVLYLVLPSDDYSKVTHRLPDYLCLLEAPTKLIYLRLREGAGVDLRFGRMYLTRRLLAERLRSLEAQGFIVRLPRRTAFAPPQPRRSGPASASAVSSAGGSRGTGNGPRSGPG